MMRVLLDTHAFLWFVGGSTQLSTTAQAIIAEPTTEPLLSVHAGWPRLPNHVDLPDL
jgi:PIN domain nuclease of toxin-antitoxin system